MKKVVKLFAAVLTVASISFFCSCSGDRMKTSESGMTYRFIEMNEGAQQIKVGDLPIGMCTLRLNDSVIGKTDAPCRLYPAVTNPMFPGDINEGLLMMHIGDKAIFGVSADSLAKRGMRFPNFYKEGTGMILYYEFAITDIITKDEFDQEKSIYNENLKQQQEEEKEIVANYIKENKIKATPTDEGLYIIVNKKGKGPNKVEIGRNVAINYTGHLLDGKIFDSSSETIAKENNVYDASRKYGPIKYKVGETSFIPGWEQGVINQPAGSKLTLIIPSWLAYGSKGMGDIPPFSTLVFDIEIVSVN